MRRDRPGTDEHNATSRLRRQITVTRGLLGYRIWPSSPATTDLLHRTLPGDHEPADEGSRREGDRADRQEVRCGVLRGSTLGGRAQIVEENLFYDLATVGPALTRFFIGAMRLRRKLRRIARSAPAIARSITA